MNEILDVKYIAKYNRVLIVDDESSALEVLRDLFVMNNINVTTATNGKEALEALSNEQFDMILSDVNMPKMNGIEFLESVSVLGVSTPLVFYSAHYDLDVLRKSIQLGAFDFLSKPLSFPKLMNVVENAVEVGVLQRKIHYIHEHKNPMLYDFINEYESRVKLLRLMNYSSEIGKNGI